MGDRWDPFAVGIKKERAISRLKHLESDSHEARMRYVGHVPFLQSGSSGITNTYLRAQSDFIRKDFVCFGVFGGTSGPIRGGVQYEVPAPNELHSCEKEYGNHDRFGSAYHCKAVRIF